MVYKANVKRIVTEKQGDQVRAVGVELADGRVYRCAPTGLEARARLRVRVRLGCG